MAATPPANAAERVRQRVRDLLDQEGRDPEGQRRTRAGLARWIPKSAASVTQKINVPDGKRKFGLDELDRIAKYFDVSPGELVAYEDSAFHELRPAERRWLTHYQNLPRAQRDAFLGLLDYFMAASPAETRLHRIVSQLRRLSDEDLQHFEWHVNETVRLSSGAPSTATARALRALDAESAKRVRKSRQARQKRTG